MFVDNPERIKALVQRVKNGIEFKSRLKLLEMNLVEAQTDEEASTVLGDFLEGSQNIIPPFVRRRIGKQLNSIVDSMEEESETIPREIIDEVVENMREAIEKKEQEACDLLFMVAYAIGNN